MVNLRGTHLHFWGFFQVQTDNIKPPLSNMLDMVLGLCDCLPRGFGCSRKSIFKGLQPDSSLFSLYQDFKPQILWDSSHPLDLAIHL